MQFLDLIPEQFFLDEVRCGFYVPAVVKQAWATSLRVLYEIDVLCKKHNISYFADWGTYLGAVRHGGFIPWDDDLDILMKREDYTRFLAVSNELPEGFHVQTHQSERDNWLFMGKVVGRNQISYEKEHLRNFFNFPYIASVDIFVLDYVYRDQKKEQSRCDLCKRMLAVADGLVEGSLSFQKVNQYLKDLEENGMAKLSGFHDSFTLSKLLYKEVERLFAIVPEEESDYLVQLFPWGLKGTNRYYDKKYYEKSISVPFEFMTIPLPAHFDELLRLRYGEYWKCNKTAGAHDYPFFEGQKKNLQSVLDFEMPSFKPVPLELQKKQQYKESGYKELTSTIEMFLTQEVKEIQSLFQNGLFEDIFEKSAELQQTIVDYGNIIEMVKGEEHPIISILEKICDDLYLLCENHSLEYIDSLTENLERFSEETKKIVERKDYVLLYSNPEAIKNWKEYIEKIIARDNIDFYLIQCPLLRKDFDGRLYHETELPGDEAVSCLNYTDLPEDFLLRLHPDSIYFQNGYDEWHPTLSVPSSIYVSELRYMAEQIIWLPEILEDDYEEANPRAIHNLSYILDTPGAMYANKIIVRSENHKEYYETILKQIAKEKSYEFTGELEVYPSSRNERKTGSRKQVLYMISLGAKPDDEEIFQKKLKHVKDVMLEHQEISFTFSIYPDYKNFRNQLNDVSFSFVEFQAIHLEDYDAYYGDVTPLLVDATRLKIPVMIQDWKLT